MKPEAVYAFDVDGTLTTPGQPFDDVLGLKPNQKILDLALFHQSQQGSTIAITTARDESIRKQTVAWLKKNGLKPKYILMRGKGDPRPDPEVKVEQITILVKNFGNNITMYDDKQENCKAVREQTGIRCINVKNPQESKQ